MGKITDIAPQKKHKSRVSLYIDGEFFCGLEKLTVLEHRLKIGDEVDERKLSAAVFDSEVTQAFDKAAGYLASRPHTEEELKKYLAGKGFTAAVVDRALEKMAGYGYIDDAEFVRAYIESHRAKYGVKRMALELARKGVDRALVDEALDALDQSEDATNTARKYLRTHEHNKYKLRAYLFGKGFDPDAVDAAIDTLSEEGAFEESEDDDF